MRLAYPGQEGQPPQSRYSPRAESAARASCPLASVVLRLGVARFVPSDEPRARIAARCCRSGPPALELAVRRSRRVQHAGDDRDPGGQFDPVGDLPEEQPRNSRTPTTGTSIENGATTLDGWRLSRVFHDPVADQGREHHDVEQPEDRRQRLGGEGSCSAPGRSAAGPSTSSDSDRASASAAPPTSTGSGAAASGPRPGGCRCCRWPSPAPAQRVRIDRQQRRRSGRGGRRWRSARRRRADADRLPPAQPLVQRRCRRAAP